LYKISEDIIDNRKTLLSDKINSLLKRSKTVHIASGYFRISGWDLIKENFKYIEKMKLVMGIKTNVETAKEIEKGYKIKKDIIKKDFLKKIYDELDDLDHDQTQKSLELYHFIENEKIDVRIYDKQFFHSKVYLFNHIDVDFPCTSIIGSSNFTNQGLTHNIELNSILRSKSAYDYLIEWFDEIWEEAEPFDSALLDTRSSFLNKESKPNDDSLSGGGQESSPEQDFETPEEEKVNNPFNMIIWKIPQSIGYQNWLNNGKKGILQIATGVGKTLIGLRAIFDFFKNNQDNKSKTIVLIGVHSNPMISQWKEEIMHWLKSPIIQYIQTLSGESKGTIDQQLDDLNLNIELFDNIIIIAHYNTLCSKVVPFLNKFSDHKILFIADEVHELGTSNRIKKIRDFTPDTCLGLSATPSRYFDSTGTNFLKKFFNGIIYKYTINDAIKDGYLCGYYYKPVLVDLTDEEYQKYMKYTRKLAIAQSNTPINKEEIRDIATARSRIVKKAKEKDDVVIQLINKVQNKLRENDKKLEHMLIYFEDNDQLSETARKIPLNIISEKITQGHPSNVKDRKKIIKKLKIGAIQMLLAIQILDQGINIPELRYAIIVSSTGNEKQYIQRRGRILRPLKKKDYAVIYDLVIPRIENEKKRVKIFYNSCWNKAYVRDLFNEYEGFDIEEYKIKIERSEIIE